MGLQRHFGVTYFDIKATCCFLKCFCSLAALAALQNLPESNPMRMEETRKRNMMVLQAIKDAAETDENLARTLGQRGK